MYSFVQPCSPVAHRLKVKRNTHKKVADINFDNMVKKKRHGRIPFNRHIYVEQLGGIEKSVQMSIQIKNFVIMRIGCVINSVAESANTVKHRICIF